MTYEHLGISATVIAGAAKLVYNTAKGAYEYVNEQKVIDAQEDAQGAVDFEKWKREHGAYGPTESNNSFILPALAIGAAALLAFK
jgi:hypothetical protein